MHRPTGKPLPKHLQSFRDRAQMAAVLAGIFFLLLLGRLFYLQVILHDEYQEMAENNRTANIPIAPNRGIITDRNGVVLATNYSDYTIEITPARLRAPLEQVLEQLSQVIEIRPQDRRQFKKLRDQSRQFDSVPIRTRVAPEELARFAAQRYRFPGVEIRARLFRKYPYETLASHAMGHIGRINEQEKRKLTESENENNYRGTDYIGKLGIEQSYETELHGITGYQVMETRASGRAVRSLRAKNATPGQTVVLTIDSVLQQLIEQLYGDRRGAMVVLDPRSGEVLAFVSKPTFDLNLFVEGIGHEDWKSLNESPDRPLLNRALRGTYPPGSTYKPFMGLIALETGLRTPGQSIYDPGYFMLGDHKFRDSNEDGHGTVDLHKSIVVSSDTYYYILAHDMGVDLMHDHLRPLGFGQNTGIDIQGESRGVLPSTEWKRKTHKTPDQQRWYAGETISLGIGQGYNHFTMLQLALATATLANRGLQMRPHLVKAVIDPVSSEQRNIAPEQTAQLNYQPDNLAVIRRAMTDVNLYGTSARSFAGAPYTSGGKTGTTQVFTIKQGEKYNASRIDERLRDHALFIAFAPVEDPKVALALVVENGGFGAQSAAPIARRVLDHLLAGRYPSAEDIAAVQRGQATQPIGQHRPIPATPIIETLAETPIADSKTAPSE